MSDRNDSIASTPTSTLLWARTELVIYHLCILGICAVLIGAFVVQFGEGELPCPLCLIQRMCMILAALGPAYIIIEGRSRHAHSFSVMGSGFGTLGRGS